MKNEMIMMMFAPPFLCRVVALSWLQLPSSWPHAAFKIRVYSQEHEEWDTDKSVQSRAGYCGTAYWRK